MPCSWHYLRYRCFKIFLRAQSLPQPRAGSGWHWAGQGSANVELRSYLSIRRQRRLTPQALAQFYETRKFVCMATPSWRVGPPPHCRSNVHTSTALIFLLRCSALQTAIKLHGSSAAHMRESQHACMLTVLLHFRTNGVGCIRDCMEHSSKLIAYGKCTRKIAW